MSSYGKYSEAERERKRERERARERESKRERERARARESERERERKSRSWQFVLGQNHTSWCFTVRETLSLSGVKSIRSGCSSLYSTGTSGKLSPALLWIHAVKHKAELLLQTQTKTQSEAWIDDASKKAWAGFILLELIFRNNSMTLDFHKLH